MPLANHPSVGVNHLRALSELLKSAAGTKAENLIETQHLDSSRKGDADEKKENTTPHATRSVSITDSHTALADPAPRRAAESSGAACRTVLTQGVGGNSSAFISGLMNDQCEWMIFHAPLIFRYTSLEFHRATTFSVPSGCFT
jgi:hypothetical protein